MKYEYKLMMPSMNNIADICSKLHWKIHDHRAVERWIHRGCELHPSGGPLLSKICRRPASHSLIIHLIAITQSSASCGFCEQLICFRQKGNLQCIIWGTKRKLGLYAFVGDNNWNIWRTLNVSDIMNKKMGEYCNWLRVLLCVSDDALRISLWNKWDVYTKGASFSVSGMDCDWEMFL